MNNEVECCLYIPWPTYTTGYLNELATIRQRLAENRHTLPRFQPQQWVKNLEALCWELWGKFHRELGDFVP